MFDVKAFLEGAQVLLDGVEKVAPLAAALGVPFVSPAATIAAKLAAVAEAALDRAADAQYAMTTDDTDGLKALIVRLTALAESAEAEADAAERRVLEA